MVLEILKTTGCVLGSCVNDKCPLKWRRPNSFKEGHMVLEILKTTGCVLGSCVNDKCPLKWRRPGFMRLYKEEEGGAG